MFPSLLRSLQFGTTLNRQDERHLVTLRLDYEQLCDIIKHLDILFTLPIGIMLAGLVPLVCFMAYLLLISTPNNINYIQTFLSLALVFGLLIPAAKLHHCVSTSCFDSLHVIFNIQIQLWLRYLLTNIVSTEMPTLAGHTNHTRDNHVP